MVGPCQKSDCALGCPWAFTPPALLLVWGRVSPLKYWSWSILLLVYPQNKCIVWKENRCSFSIFLFYFFKILAFQAFPSFVTFSKFLVCLIFIPSCARSNLQVTAKLRLACNLLSCLKSHVLHFILSPCQEQYWELSHFRLYIWPNACLETLDRIAWEQGPEPARPHVRPLLGPALGEEEPHFSVGVVRVLSVPTASQCSEILMPLVKCKSSALKFSAYIICLGLGCHLFILILVKLPSHFWEV